MDVERHGTHGCVLVVDDEIDVAHSIAEILRQGLPHCDIREAHSGEDALEIIASGDIDVLLTDHRMPGMDGLELLADARNIDAELAFIVCSAFPDVAILERAVNEHRIQKFFTKPLEPAQVIDGVAEVLWHHARKRMRNAVVRRVQNTALDAARPHGNGTP